MMPGICRFLMENYRDEIETALRLTREEDVEHGFTVIGEVGELPDVTIIEGEEGMIETGEIPPGPDIGIGFHAHHVPEDIIEGKGRTADAIIQGSLSSIFSPEDIGSFTHLHLQHENSPESREPGFIRGSAIATWGRPEMADLESYLTEYKLRGIEITDEVVGLPFEERREIAIAVGLAYDGEVPDDPLVPDWFPDEEDLPAKRKDRFEMLDGIKTCRVGPFELDKSLDGFKDDIRDRM